MDEVILISTGLKLGFALVALLVAVLFLRFLDRRMGIRFSVHVWDTIKRDPLALAVYFGVRFAGVCLLIGRVIGALALVIGLGMALASPVAAGPISRAYDESLRRASAQYLPGIDWRLLKAQLYQESRLDPTARSPAGAEGLAQFMGPTWAEISRQLGYHGISRTVAGPAIDGAAYYMAQLKQRWRAADELDRHRLAAASYNAGPGNISRASRGCGGALIWAAVSPCLPDVTGRHSAETQAYVERIWRWWAMLEAGA